MNIDEIQHVIIFYMTFTILILSDLTKIYESTDQFYTRCSQLWTKTSKSTDQLYVCRSQLRTKIRNLNQPMNFIFVVLSYGQKTSKSVDQLYICRSQLWLKKI